MSRLVKKSTTQPKTLSLSPFSLLTDGDPSMPLNLKHQISKGNFILEPKG